MKINLYLLFFLSGIMMSAQDQAFRTYHSDLVLNDVGTTWKVSESEDGEIGFISISDQHSYWNKLVLSFSLPKCNEPIVFFQIFTAGFRKHEGIVEREDLLNETKLVMQVDEEPPYWVNSEIISVSKFENVTDKEFYQKHFTQDKDLLFDIFTIEIKNGTTLIKRDDSLVKKLSLLVPPESPYHIYLDGFHLLTFGNNGFQQAMKEFAELCQKRQSENGLLLGAIK